MMGGVTLRIMAFRYDAVLFESDPIRRRSRGSGPGLEQEPTRPARCSTGPAHAARVIPVWRTETDDDRGLSSRQKYFSRRYYRPQFRPLIRCMNTDSRGASVPVREE